MCGNSWQAVVEAVKPHGMVARAAIESCSGAADFAEELICHAEWNVDLAHPGYVSRMRLNPDKTDYSDARMLADLERVGYESSVRAGDIRRRINRLGIVGDATASIRPQSRGESSRATAARSRVWLAGK